MDKKTDRAVDQNMEHLIDFDWADQGGRALSDLERIKISIESHIFEMEALIYNDKM